MTTARSSLPLIAAAATLLLNGPPARVRADARAANEDAPAVDAARARADVATELSDKDAQGAVRPRAVGVSPEAQSAARRLFLRGNLLLNDGLFSQAIREYREALARWDHPGIHYNYAIASLTLDQTRERRGSRSM